jgi:hypothetical protein
MSNGEMMGSEIAAVASVHETSVAAVAAQARAMVEARFLVALRRPRDVDDFRVRILRDCARPGFAEVALYSLPRGGKRIEGPSIRFVEAALRCYGNVDVLTPTLYEDEDKIIVRVSVTDLETNATYATDHTIRKTIERRDAKGREVIEERLNSTGQTVYLVRPTDDELMQKVGSIVSRAIRTNGLRILPGDVVEECAAKIRETLVTKDAADPDAARKKIADAFSAVGVLPSDLVEYLGHALDQSSPAELANLRTVYAALRDGQTTFAELLEARRNERGDKDRDATPCDKKDLEKIGTAAGKRAAQIGEASITPATITAEVCKLFKASGPEALCKADLPGVLKMIAQWNPPGGDGSKAEAEAK